MNMDCNSEQEVSRQSGAATSFETANLNGIEVQIPRPTQLPSVKLVGQKALLDNCLSAFTPLRGKSLSFRLTGPPGVGKNALAYEVARVLNRPLYVLQGNADLQPEDLACRYRMTGDNRIEYVASELMAAMLNGCIFLFDEIGKVPPRSLSLLASVLDDRRTLTSSQAAITVQSHPEFRFMATLNDADAAVAGLPGFIDERLRPQFRVEYPGSEELLEIVNQRITDCDQLILESFREYAFKRISQKCPVSPREALNFIGYLTRQSLQSGKFRSRQEIDARIRQAESLISMM